MSQVTEIYSNVNLSVKDTVFQKLRNILADVLVVEANKITRDADLENDLGAESIDFVDLSFRVEEEFGISFRLEELRSSSDRRKYTVDVLANYIVRLLDSAPAEAAG